jgi:hypothetical protein
MEAAFKESVQGLLPHSDYFVGELYRASAGGISQLSRDVLVVRLRPKQNQQRPHRHLVAVMRGATMSFRVASKEYGMAAALERGKLFDGIIY